MVGVQADQVRDVNTGRFNSPDICCVLLIRIGRQCTTKTHTHTPYADLVADAPANCKGCWTKMAFSDSFQPKPFYDFVPFKRDKTLSSPSGCLSWSGRRLCTGIDQQNRYCCPSRLGTACCQLSLSPSLLSSGFPSSSIPPFFQALQAFLFLIQIFLLMCVPLPSLT